MYEACTYAHIHVMSLKVHKLGVSNLSISILSTLIYIYIYKLAKNLNNGIWPLWSGSCLPSSPEAGWFYSLEVCAVALNSPGLIRGFLFSFLVLPYTARLYRQSGRSNLLLAVLALF